MRHASGPAAGQMNGTSLRLGEGVSGWVAANRQVMINSEASLDLGEQAYSGSCSKHALSVPLITRESLVGTITLYSETTFTESQSRLVQVIAPHLAQAIWAAKRDEGAAHTSHAQTRARQARPSRHASRLDALRHSRSDRSSAPTLLLILPSTFFDLRRFLREFSDSSLGVYLALPFSDRARRAERCALCVTARHERRNHADRVMGGCDSGVGVGVRRCDRRRRRVPAFTLPANIQLLHDIELAIQSIYDRSPSFRAQCARIAAADNLRVTVRIDPFNPGPLPGVHRVRRHGQKIRAEIHLPPSSDHAELLAHEFEHSARADRGARISGAWRASKDSGVYQLDYAVFETERAQDGRTRAVSGRGAPLSRGRCGGLTADL